MTYCNDCVKTGFCFDMRKSETENIICHKFQDKNYKNFSRDSDCDAVTDGACGIPAGTHQSVERNRKARDVGSVFQNQPNSSKDISKEKRNEKSDL